MSGAGRRIVPATETWLRQGARLLRAGQVVAFPTETVYGLGADATNARAVAAIFAIKGRPRFNPLIVHVAGIQEAARLVALDGRARLLARAFWPGPLSLVLPRRAGSRVCWLASAGLDSLAVRVPAHPVARRLIALARRPIAAPSANPSGRLSPTSAGDVGATLRRGVALILDGGRTAVGVESTIVDLCGTAPVLLRPGGISAEAIEAIVGPLAAATTAEGAPRAPGQLSSHYAPRLPLRLGAAGVGEGEALLGFGPVAADARPQDLDAYRNLSPAGDLAEAAANLFAYLRALDRPRYRAIAVMAVPERGLGAAINDRLRRAAAPRPMVLE